MNLRFHWMLPGGGEVGMKTAQETSRVLTTKRASPGGIPDMNGWLKFARSAEDAGIEAVLQSFGRYVPDTFQVACALGQASRPTVRGTKMSSEIGSSSSRNRRRTTSWSHAASQSVVSTSSGCLAR